MTIANGFLIAPAFVSGPIETPRRQPVPFRCKAARAPRFPRPLSSDSSFVLQTHSLALQISRLTCGTGNNPARAAEILTQSPTSSTSESIAPTAKKPPAPPTMPQPLSAKESSLFRQVIRNYEDKQYKRGLKAAEQILKKNPKHGDTMAMKALIMNQQGKTDEAFALGKEALTADMKSHICWHVYGLLYRHQKNFEEAIKAYKFALRLEPESAQIQRDLALLQAQMRDYQGYIQSRTAMLQARPQVRQNWSALAIAHHLAGDLVQAEKVLTSYEESLKTPPPKTDLEHSEALKYKNYIIAETGDYQRALDHLESIAKNGLDRLYVLERRAQYLGKLDKKDEAIKAYRKLLERNPDHSHYYDKLIEVLDISAGDQAAKKAVYDEYATKFPRADAPKRLPLDFLEGM